MIKSLLFFVVSAVVALSACSKSEVAPVNARHEVRFQTVAGLNTKAITGTEFPKNETFSAYAWADGTVGPYFMDNETIGYDTVEEVWKPVGSTFYWPKNTTVDFICYYPAGMAGITVAEKKLNFTSIDVKALQEDVMYSDKAAGFSDNADLVDDAVNAYTGVPVIFRHALAKVKFVVELTYD